MNPVRNTLYEVIKSINKEHNLFSQFDSFEFDYEGRRLYTRLYSGSFVIKDLTNAGRVGKRVNSLTMSYNDHESHEFPSHIFHKLDLSDLIKILDCAEEGLVDDSFFRVNNEKAKLYKSVHQAVRFLSHDLTIYKPLKELPKKWTINHVIRLIVNKQYTNLKKDGHYTDDYAYDAQVNYGKGEIKDRLSFCKNIVESPSGWRVRYNDKTKYLDIDCYSYDNNSLQVAI